MRVSALLWLAAFVALPGWSGGAQDLTSLSIEQLLEIKVEGASLHPQSLEDAPASVTILTAEDLRKYGYRTLAEALGSVRGFYAGYNRTYHTVGVRGFHLPGDYASRFLVMVNGHNLADNIFNFVLSFGNDFPLDMNLVKRIEIIRGPTSALYGSNGIFATINIITKPPEEAGPSRLTASLGSFGERKAQVMTTASLGASAQVLFSGAVFNNRGESPLFFPQFNVPETNYGQAIRMDNEKGYHFFANLAWKNWNVTAAFSDRQKIQPISFGPTVFNDRGTNTNDTRNYVEAAYMRDLHGGTLRWRAYYDSFHSRRRSDLPIDVVNPADSGVEDNREFFYGDWVGTELTYRFDVSHLGTLTVGGEAKFDLQNLQRSFDVSPAPSEFLNVSRRDKSVGLFAQEERQLSRRWKMNLGARLDVSANRNSFFSPHAALIYQPTSEWTCKFLYGRAFRNPSAFDLYFEDGGRSGASNPAARSEKADTLEVDLERRLGKRLRLLAAAYTYRLNNFLVGEYVGAGVIQYRNVGKIQASGFEIELHGQPAGWLEATASYSIQKSRDNDPDGRLENSPDHLAKLRFAVPLGRKFDASSGMQYYSSRRTLGGAEVKPVYLADFTIPSRRLLPNFDLQFGLRNAFNRNYSDPIALTQQVDSLRQAGRSFFVELTARARD